jgi:hypothetical protein
MPKKYYLNPPESFSLPRYQARMRDVIERLVAAAG